VFSNTLTPTGLTSIGVTTVNAVAVNTSNLVVTGGIQFANQTVNGVLTVGGGNGTVSTLTYTGSGSVILSVNPVIYGPTIDVITAPATSYLSLNGGGAGANQVVVSSLANLLVGTTTDFSSGSGQLKVNSNAQVGGTLTCATVTSPSGSNLALNAGGTNQSIVFTPSGTGTVQASPSGYFQIPYSGTSANSHGIQIGTGNTSSFIFSNYGTFGDGSIWSDNYTVTNSGVTSIPYATNPTSAIRQHLGAIYFMNGAANVAPTANVEVSPLGNLLIGTSSDFSSGAGQLKVNGVSVFGNTLSATANGNVLTLNNTQSATNNGLILLQRQGTNKFYVGLDPSDNFSILNNKATTALFGLTSAGNATVHGTLAVVGTGNSTVAGGLAVSGVFNLAGQSLNVNSSVTPDGTFPMNVGGTTIHVMYTNSP
jgi:hypothetical protein